MLSREIGLDRAEPPRELYFVSKTLLSVERARGRRFRPWSIGGWGSWGVTGRRAFTSPLEKWEIMPHF